jgi:hypothetical protein
MFVSGHVWRCPSELGFLKHYHFIDFCKVLHEVILYAMDFKEGDGIPAFIMLLDI